MLISIFPTVQATSIEIIDTTWEAFAERCKNPHVHASKATCPLIKLATFGEQRTQAGCIRSEANMLAVTGVEGDYDAGIVSPEAARDMLAMYGITAVIYTSPSHTLEAPRWRVLAPLATSVSVAERRALAGRLNAALGGILAAESYVGAQSFYIGRVSGVEYECYTVDGAPIDTHGWIEPVYPSTTSVTIATSVHPDREATDATIRELESALTAIPADDYETWTSVGIALSGIGERGFALWSAWSAGSDAHRGDSDLVKWNTFVPDRTGFASVFARAQRHGWLNPRAGGTPVDLVAVYAAAQAVTSDAPPVPVEQPFVRTNSNIVTAEEQPALFKGCTYIANTRQMLVPNAPYIVDKARFDELSEYAGRGYVMNPSNSGALEKSAWQAYLQSSIFNFPRASGWCFRPERPPGAIHMEEGESLVNLWGGFKVERTPGDVTPFIEHLSKILPNDRDRAIFTSFLACMVQHPGFKIQYAPVVQGAKGNGKSFLGSCIEKSLGAGYVHYPNSADITNKFTGWLQRKLCVIVEEISTQDKRETLEVLKPLITNMRIEMQAKGVDQVTGDNRANFIFFVNQHGAIPTDKDERRYCIFHTAQQTAEDIGRDGMGGDYFPKLWTWARNGGFANVAHYLATYEIPEDYNPVNLARAPRTSSFDEAVGASIGNFEAEILDAVDAGLEGFCGGWIASHKLDAYIADRKIERMAGRSAKKRMLTTLGYVMHPELFNGRISNPLKGVLPICRPVLYLKKDHPVLAIKKPSEILAAYLEAQREAGAVSNVFGV